MYHEFHLYLNSTEMSLPMAQCTWISPGVCRSLNVHEFHQYLTPAERSVPIAQCTMNFTRILIQQKGTCLSLGAPWISSAVSNFSRKESANRSVLYEFHLIFNRNECQFTLNLNRILPQQIKAAVSISMHHKLDHPYLSSAERSGLSVARYTGAMNSPRIFTST